MRLIDRVKQNPALLAGFATPPKTIQEAAINANPNSIRYIRNPSNKIQILAVSKGGVDTYKLISAPTYQAKMELVKKNPRSIMVVGYDYDELNKIAIEKDPSLIVHMSNPSYQIQKLVLEKKSNYVSRIRNPHPDIIKEYLKEFPRRYDEFQSIPYSIEIEILKKYERTRNELVSAFNRFRNPTPSLQEYYIKRMSFYKSKPFNYGDMVRLTNRISDHCKEILMQNLDFSVYGPETFNILKEIFEGNDELSSILTIVM